MSATVLETVATSTPRPQADGEPLVVDEKLYEVVDGKKVELPPMSAFAVWIASRLFFRLALFADTSKTGTTVAEMLFILDQMRNLRRRPDVAFVSTERWPMDRGLPKTGDWAVVPDLAIEVASPNDLLYEVMAKLHEYFGYGVREVWIVLPPHEQIYVYSSPTEVRIWSAGEELDGGTLLPGFRLRVADLFRPETTQAPRAAGPV